MGTAKRVFLWFVAYNASRFIVMFIAMYGYH
ncbi:hypothetical protein LCGC14_0338060 [marine sediment metagenome]|uniref:Uncharacterized protein n=1 Tax=marine sediment metagenome TaxID=412755 RepID=A0A0F9TXB9_9ZZZZ